MRYFCIVFLNISLVFIPLTSSREQEIVTSLIDKRIAPADDYYYCIGGLQRDSGWTWITGEAFEYTNWGKNEPDGATKQWFLALASTRVRSYNSHLKVVEWEDANNSDLHGFICE